LKPYPVLASSLNAFQHPSNNSTSITSQVGKADPVPAQVEMPLTLKELLNFSHLKEVAEVDMDLIVSGIPTWAGTGSAFPTWEIAK